MQKKLTDWNLCSLLEAHSNIFATLYDWYGRLSLCYSYPSIWYATTIYDKIRAHGSTFRWENDGKAIKLFMPFYIWLSTCVCRRRSVGLAEVAVQQRLTQMLPTSRYWNLKKMSIVLVFGGMYGSMSA